MEGRVRSERQWEGLYCVPFSLSGRKPGQGENLIGCDSVVKQTSSNIASELQKRRPGVWERTDCWCVWASGRLCTVCGRGDVSTVVCNYFFVCVCSWRIFFLFNVSTTAIWIAVLIDLISSGCILTPHLHRNGWHHSTASEHLLNHRTWCVCKKQ